MDQNNIIEACAEAAHEANRIYCAARGDTSQVPWKDAPDWQRQSAIEGVRVALGGATPEGQHEAWCVAKLRDGWIWGPVKDPMTKQHPCLVPYADLPPEQRVKDGLYLAVVRAMAAALGVGYTIGLDSGARVMVTPVDTDAGLAFKLTATEPLLKSEAPAGAREVFTGKGQRGDANGSCG